MIKRIFSLLIFTAYLPAQQMMLSSSRNDPSVKTQIYLFKPNAIVPNLQTGMQINASLDGIGLSYRRGAWAGFYDVEMFHTGHGFIFDASEKIKGSSQTGNFTFSRALATSGKYIRAYLLAGGGVSYNAVTIGKFNRMMQPILTTKIGLDCNYGFIDFGCNIPVPTLHYEYDIVYLTEEGYSSTRVAHSYSIIPVTRIGVGFTF